MHIHCSGMGTTNGGEAVVIVVFNGESGWACALDHLPTPLLACLPLCGAACLISACRHHSAAPA